MSNETPNWTKEELRAYVLIYSANADFTETRIEKNAIQARIENVDFDKIHIEFDRDNDYQSIQKIQTSMEKHGFTKAEKDELFTEIKEVFKSDGAIDILEENLFRGLKHILG